MSLEEVISIPKREFLHMTYLRTVAHKFVLFFVILLAFGLRTYGLNWDQNQHLHPDERAIVMNVTNPSFHWPVSSQEWNTVLTVGSPLNPHWFPYGSLPLYLLKFIGYLGSFVNPSFAQYDKLNLLGRGLSALLDTGTTLLIFLITFRISKRWLTSLLAMFLYAMAVLPIQLSHFYAVDVPMTFFITLTLYFCLRRNPWLIGIAAGLAFATKASSLPLFLPIFLSFLPLYKAPKKLFLELVICILVTTATFMMAMPYAVIDFPSFYHQLTEQQAMTRNPFVFPYTLQFVGNIPYLYPLKNILLWGLGPVLALPAFFGSLWLTIMSIRKRNQNQIVLFSFLWLFFGIVGGFAVGFIRYLLPIYPILVISAVLFLDEVFGKLIFPIFIALALVWPISFMHIYSVSNTRTTASEWIYMNIPAGAKIAREHWEDGLPIGGPNNYEYLELPMYEPDNEQKWAKINDVLRKADYIIIASNRLYAPLMKLINCETLPPGRCYKQTAEYYQKLFTGQLGYTKVAEITVYPTIPLINYPINDFSADEVFTVYDHPKVMIFKKNE